MMRAVRTGVVDHGQCRHSPIYEHTQRFDNGRVRLNEGDVVVGTDAELAQCLLHEGRLGHLTHLNKQH